MNHSAAIVNATNRGNMICSDRSFYDDGMDENELDTPGQRLTYARETAGFETAADFAAKAGINPTTYRAYENDQNGYTKYATKFAKLLKVSTDWLLVGGPVPDQADKSRAIAQIDHLKTDFDIEMVRNVDIAYAMGDGALVEDYPEMGITPFDRNFLRALGAKLFDRLFLCRGEGDSMSPTIFDSDLVLVDATVQRITMQDRIWALTVAGAGMIKRVRMLPNDEIMVISDNPSVPPQTYQADDVHIVGRVLWIGRRM